MGEAATESPSTARERILEAARTVFGGMAYELIKSGVPALERYGYVSTRDLGVNSCRQAFPCQFSASPLMERARQVRSLATDFCDLEGDSYTSSACRMVAYAVDTFETL